ncbi:hypothetical protein HELRODRAFT_165887 [Helobdella robusta]|uniref:Uncharacterized protein n=1 Tax=Helobdella robusta TaxID=6412 RepID=T1EXE7_HELRO|nr:hypothetical protein HELRODRAFT_165887 [Helobdella robusta]ESN91807.1 hypothetical protein HELRODRAFT_165887 [Helobdella robusta]
MLQVTNKYHLQISNHVIDDGSIQAVTIILQKMYKTYTTWRKTIEDLMVRWSNLPQTFTTDQEKLSALHSFKALCSIQTNEMSLKEGEHVTVTDSHSRPNQLKIKNTKGMEGYMSVLSCFLPTPDLNLTNCIERLQVQLTTYWTDSVSKALVALKQNVLASVKELLLKIDEIPATSASRKFQERCQRFLSAVELRDEFMIRYISQALRDLENDFIQNNYEGVEIFKSETTVQRNSIAEIDKPLLYYTALVDNLLSYKQQLSIHCRPVIVKELNLSALKQCQNRQRNKQTIIDIQQNHRYIELKITSMETTTRDERTYRTLPPTTTTAATTQRTGISRRCNIDYVVDARSGERLSMKDAVAAGILDNKSGSYVNIETGKKEPIASALAKGLIKVSFSNINTPLTGGSVSSTTDNNNTADVRTNLSTPNPMEATPPVTTINNVNGTSHGSFNTNQNVISSRDVAVDAESDSRILTKPTRKESGEEDIETTSHPFANPLTTGVTEVASNVDDSRSQPQGLITLRTRVYRDEYDIVSVRDHLTDRMVSPQQARNSGIIDGGLFRNTLTDETVVLDEAVRRGWIEVNEWKSKDGEKVQTRNLSCEVDSSVKRNQNVDDAFGGGDVSDDDAVTYAVDGVMDRMEERYVSFVEAIKRGLLHSESGCFVDNLTKAKIYPAEAIRLGYMKVTRVETPRNNQLTTYKPNTNRRSRNYFSQFFDLHHHPQNYHHASLIQPVVSQGADAADAAKESARTKTIAVFNVPNEHVSSFSDSNNNFSPPHNNNNNNDSNGNQMGGGGDGGSVDVDNINVELKIQEISF